MQAGEGKSQITNHMNLLLRRPLTNRLEGWIGRSRLCKAGAMDRIGDWQRETSVPVFA